jgi:hypothetical protein
MEVVSLVAVKLSHFILWLEILQTNNATVKVLLILSYFLKWLLLQTSDCIKVRDSVHKASICVGCATWTWVTLEDESAQ